MPDMAVRKALEALALVLTKDVSYLDLATRKKITDAVEILDNELSSLDARLRAIEDQLL